MAETIGLIASVLQVAGAGLKLSQTLYQYAESVNSADRRIKDIAKEVQLTSLIVDELGTLFKQNDTSSLLSKNALNTADETVRECSTVFLELDAALAKHKKNAFGRLKFPFREPKIELLRSHIDKLKSTLQLLMQVLTHAHQIAAKKLDREAEAAQRQEIKTLLLNKKNSTKRYEESVRKYSTSEESTLLDDHDETDQNMNTLSGVTFAAASVSPTITAKTLETCVQHIRGLLENIENLQKVLSNHDNGLDNSKCHQETIESYFQARSHLDSVLLGNPRGTGSSISGAAHIGTTDYNTIRPSLHAGHNQGVNGAVPSESPNTSSPSGQASDNIVPEKIESSSPSDMSTDDTLSRRSTRSARSTSGMSRRSILACTECRKRRVHCDSAVPACSTCVRRGIQCPGYRVQQSFVFHKFEEIVFDNSEIARSPNQSCSAYSHDSQALSPSPQGNTHIHESEDRTGMRVQSESRKAEEEREQDVVLGGEQYERRFEGSSESRRSEIQTQPHQRHTPEDDGDSSPVDIGASQAAIGFSGLSFQGESSPPAVSSNHQPDPYTDPGPSEDNAFFSPVAYEDTAPLSDDPSLQRIAGTLRTERHLSDKGRSKTPRSNDTDDSESLTRRLGASYVGDSSIPTVPRDESHRSEKERERELRREKPEANRLQQKSREDMLNVKVPPLVQSSRWGLLSSGPSSTRDSAEKHPIPRKRRSDTALPSLASRPSLSDGQTRDDEHESRYSDDDEPLLFGMSEIDTGGSRGTIDELRGGSEGREVAQGKLQERISSELEADEEVDDILREWTTVIA
ncbi:unnamed protein product [Periconia digitata]|uniref:Zn(2)-C6 fungal-type domain-containing protein n=1 Tax=Periconia digitata TaxID=1303443 RepID=A0A9W4XXW4_9PLEO|nr:unnamed protein product [Periconia digitata]